MKKLALIAFAALATSAFAAPGGPGPSISITGTSVQSTSLIYSTVDNSAKCYSAVAQQNLASNAGNVSIAGKSEQDVTSNGSSIRNAAMGAKAYASQNLASNVGNVTVAGSGKSAQYVYLKDAHVSNTAGAGTVAVQNIASNNACVTCN